MCWSQNLIGRLPRYRKLLAQYLQCSPRPTAWTLIGAEKYSSLSSQIRALTISQDWAARSVSSQMEKGKETLDIFSKIDINLKSICVQN